MRKWARKVSVKHSDGSYLSVGNFVINYWFQVFSFPGTFLGKFSSGAEVLDIGKKDMVLGLS